MNLPSLGVGITYFPELDSILQSNSELVNVLEIEPQTHWYHAKLKQEKYLINEAVTKNIMKHSCFKILHGVGSPVGGSRLPDISQIPLLLKMISEFSVPWMSEHLSFNIATCKKGDFKTGFFLPPIQTPTGIAAAVKSIKLMANQIQIPFAVENGVNYLKPRENEIPDGEFIRRVLEAANCGLVLDLHNAWTNEINGRQTVNAFLSQIPLDRVWEIHLAGGSEDDGYWLDSHCGKIPKPLVELTSDIIPKLPNLRAIILEISPSYLSIAEPTLVYSQMKLLHKLWEMRTVIHDTYFFNDYCSSINNEKNSASPSPTEWEDTIGALVVGQYTKGQLADELSLDPGINIIRKRISSVRSSMIIRTLKFTSRLLMLSLGVEQFKQLLKGYWKEFTPETFATTEGEGFAKYLEEKGLDIPYLYDILIFEKAIMSTLIYGKIERIRFPYDPNAVIDALSKRQLPVDPIIGNFEVEVEADSIKVHRT